MRSWVSEGDDSIITAVRGVLVYIHSAVHSRADIHRHHSPLTSLLGKRPLTAIISRSISLLVRPGNITWPVNSSYRLAHTAHRSIARSSAYINIQDITNIECKVRSREHARIGWVK